MIKEQFKKILHEESGNIILWLFLSYVLGVSLYFSLSEEPSLFEIRLIILAIFVALSVVRRLPILSVIMCLFLLGFFVPFLKAHLLNTIFVNQDPTFYHVEGKVESILPGSKGVVLLLQGVQVKEKQEQVFKKLSKIRINLKTELGATRVNDDIEIKAILYRPSNPVVVGGYDFARKAFFEGISAVGYAVSRPTVIREAEADSIDQIRYNITKELVDNLGLGYGGIASGLIVGEYSFIDKKLLEAIRISGLTHLLSVSGMHISIMAMIFFVAARKLCLMFARYPVYFYSKKIAALMAIAGSFLYLAISGYKVAAVRAFIMSTIYFTGIIFAKFTISKRSVILSAFLILLIWPENLIHPSFLMSFLAVIAIIVTYDRIYEKKLFSEIGYITRYLLFMIITSLVATIATLPIILINFNNVALYSLLSNLIAVPLTNAYLMPGVILYFMGYPLGLGAYVAKLMKPGLVLFEKVAIYVSGLPYSSLKVSFVDHNLVYAAVFFIVVALFLKSILLRKIFILVGFVIIIYIPFSIEIADLIVNKDLQVAMFATKKGEMEFSNKKVPNWYKSAYLAYAGSEELVFNPDIRSSEFCCDGSYCAYVKENMRLIMKVGNLFKARSSPNGCDNFQDLYPANHVIDINQVKGGFYASFKDRRIKIAMFDGLIAKRIWSK